MSTAVMDRPAPRRIGVPRPCGRRYLRPRPVDLIDRQADVRAASTAPAPASDPGEQTP